MDKFTINLLKMAGKHSCYLKPKVLESKLQQLDTLQSMGMQSVAWELEQYATPPHIATYVLHGVQEMYGDIQDKVVADLGCGCGVLAIGCVLLGARRVVGIDKDERAVEIARQNVAILGDQGRVHFMQGDVLDVQVTDKKWSDIDTVIMNPPFGTKLNEGTDKLFVEKGLELSSVVYSLHKSSTREYWKSKAAEKLKCRVQPLLQVKFNIDHSFKFHRRESRDIDVDLLRFSRMQG